MAFDFHTDAEVYFKQQWENSANYVLPFIEQHHVIKPGIQVLEIGCGEGGVLKAFSERGCIVTGVDLNKSKIEEGCQRFSKEIAEGRANFIIKNIYDVDFEKDYKNHFDIVILKDAIEHIHDQEKIIAYMKLLLKPGAMIFFGFPPWYMPFGGHQQICRNKFLSLLPYYHLLPTFLYKGVLKLFGEPKGVIDELIEIKETGISVKRFEKIVKKTGYKIVQRRLYLINPIYLYKFKLKPRVQTPVIAAVPYVRDVLSTCAYYLIEAVH